MPFTHSLSQIPTEKQILVKIKKIVFGNRVFCIKCGRQNHICEMKKNRLWRYRKCRIRFSITSINWLKGMKISVEQLWCLIWCWQKKMNVQQVQDLLNLSIPTIRRYYELFRDNLKIDDFDVVLQGKVQMDEMFVRGGFIIGAKDIKRKKIKFYVKRKKHPDKADAMNFVFHHVKPGTTLCTDGGGIYKGCEKWWPIKHKREIHSKFEFEITSEIEGMWGVLRTFIRRMYHHVTFKKLPKIVAEFEA